MQAMTLTRPAFSRDDGGFTDVSANSKSGVYVSLGSLAADRSASYSRSYVDVCNEISIKLVTFCVSRRRRKMYCGHARLCVCLRVCVSGAVRGRTPTLLYGPGCNLGAW